MSARALIVFAKAARAGEVKTRLAASSGLAPAAAARIAESLLLDTLRAASAVRDARLVVRHAPDDARTWFEPRADRFELEPQGPGDLGARLARAIRAAFERGARRVAVIGSDAPQAGAARFEQAFERLERAELVLGPARDGGYWLVALRSPCDALFESIPWSTPRVLAATRARAQDLGLDVELLEELADVDEADDLECLARELGPDGEPCPHLARLLVELELGRSAP